MSQLLLFDIPVRACLFLRVRWSRSARVGGIHQFKVSDGRNRLPPTRTTTPSYSENRQALTRMSNKSDWRAGASLPSRPNGAIFLYLYPALMYAVMFYVILNKRKLHFPLAKNVMHSPSSMTHIIFVNSFTHNYKSHMPSTASKAIHTLE